MKLFFLNKFGQNQIEDWDFVPRVGDNVDMFYQPYPTVIKVLVFPSVETKRCLGAPIDAQAIITVD